MLVKLGVDISRLAKEIRSRLGIIDHAVTIQGQEAVITSTYEGDHSPGSLHYANEAVDIRLPHKDPSKVIDFLRSALGKGYDVVLEKDHIHIEFDPR